MAEKWIYWLEEVCQEHNNLVGKKCANLGELTKAGFRVPPGYALSVDAYTRFMNESGAKEDVLKYLSTFSADPDNLSHTMKFEDASKAIRAIVESKKMPPDMEKTVREYYATLCQRTNCEDTPVATRSAGPVSHPGQYETYLHVKGHGRRGTEYYPRLGEHLQHPLDHRTGRLGLPVEHDPIGVRRADHGRR